MEQSITYKEFELFLLLNEIKYIRLSFLDLFSNWRKIALPYCAGFQNSFKKNKVDLLTLLDLRTYFKATKIKIYGIDVR